MHRRQRVEKPNLRGTFMQHTAGLQTSATPKTGEFRRKCKVAAAYRSKRGACKPVLAAQTHSGMLRPAGKPVHCLGARRDACATARVGRQVHTGGRGGRTQTEGKREGGAGDGIRTRDILLGKQALYHWLKLLDVYRKSGNKFWIPITGFHTIRDDRLVEDGV